MTKLAPRQWHTCWQTLGAAGLLTLSIVGSGACGGGGASSSQTEGTGGASSSSVSVGTGLTTGSSTGTGRFGCQSSQDCNDNKPCTLDVCDTQLGGCTHPADPCLAGQYCEPAVGCVDASPCAMTTECETTWMGDACKTKIACDPATSLCTFTPRDADGDGHAALDCGGDDCDDANATRFPGNAEICDGQDNDCLGTVEDSPACTLSSTPASASPDALAVDATSVYWMTSAIYGPKTGAVMKVPIGGGAPITLVSGQDTWYGLALDATHVYWTTNDLVGGSGTVMKAPIDGGAPITLASDQANPYGIVVDATSVYWTVSVEAGNTVVSSAVMKMPLGGGNPTTLASGQGYYFVGLAVDATHVYWTSAEGTVKKVPVGGGSAITLASGQSRPSDITVDATHVYWLNAGTDNAADAGKVMKVPLGGGAPITLASDQDFPAHLAVDATHVYWTSNAVMRVPLGGGTPTAIVALPNEYGSRDIVVDATSFYFLRDWSVEYQPK